MIGRWGRAIIQEGLNNYCAALFAKEFGRTYEESRAIADAAVKETGKRGVHGYFPMWVLLKMRSKTNSDDQRSWYVSGRKPEE